MAITGVDLLYETSRRDDSGAHYVHVYLVQSSSPTETQPTLLTASYSGTTIPVRGEAHSDDASALCSDISVTPIKRRGGNTDWIVTAPFDDPTAGGTPSDTPTDDTVKKHWSSRAYQVARSVDQAGNHITKTSGFPFDPPVMVDRHVLTLRVIRNESVFSPSLAADMAGSVNNTATTICGLTISARQARLVAFGGEAARRNGIDYWIVTYELEFDPRVWEDVTGGAFQGFDLDLVNSGFYDINDKLTLDGDIIPREEPSFLTAGGTFTTVPAVVGFRVYHERSFATLGLNI